MIILRQQKQQVARETLPPLPLLQEKVQSLDLEDATNLTPGAKRRIERWLQDDDDHPRVAEHEDESSYRPSPSSSPMLSLRSSMRPSTGSTHRSVAALAASAQMRYKI
mmetsp:Transcript_36487/g.113764  ORF Transcript_36487/g.113764 Transcript_36487/m.113764 type:complete len:108 (-) Transcript_36487:181-504(-)